MEELLAREMLNSMSILALFENALSNEGSFGATVVLSTFMLAPLTRIVVPGGKVPRKTTALFLAVSD